MKLSIVTTLYQSALYIEEFHKRASLVAQELVGDDYEIIMVNDGSPDNSLDVAVALTEQDKHLIVVDLSRNFGHHKAMMTGLMQSKGERVFLLDVDLEEEPEWLIPFAQEMEAKKADVIYGVQEKRKGNWFERVSGHVFYKVFNFLCSIELPQNLVVARLMSRVYVAALILHKEYDTLFGPLCVITGFRQNEYVVKKHSTSPTSYSLLKKISTALNAITAFSDIFLKLIFVSGLLLASISFCIILYLIGQKIIIGTVLSGWTSVMVSIWFLAGVIMLSIGVLGLYVAKIFIETKNRPYAIIRKTHGAKNIGEGNE